MSFDFVSQLIDEVALEGLDGITLETLWTRLINRKGFPLSVDSKSKKYLWKTLAGHPNLSFYELPEARPPLEYVNRFDFLDPDTGFWIETHLGADIYPLHIITGKADQGSCATYDTRRDITVDIRDKPWDPKLTLEDTVERYGDKLVVVASQAVRNTTLMGQEAKSSISLDDMEYCLLERIGRARSNGEVTTHTAINGSLGVFKIESKKLFYHCKKLIKLHLLTKQAFCIRDEKGKQLSCRLLQLRRFMCRIMSKNRTLLENVCRYLEGKDNHCEVTSILREELEMPENAFKRLVKDKTYLHLSDVPYREFYPDATEEEYLTKSMLKERNLKIIKLVKPFKGDLDEDEDEDEEDDKDQGKEVVEWVYERPLLQQALRQFERVGSQGLKQTHLQKLLRLPRLECRTVVRNLLKLGLLTSVMKSFGKQRTSILIATKFYNSSKLNQEFDKERNRLLEHLQVEPLSADDSMADVTDMETSMAEQTINTTMTQSTDVSMMDMSVSQSDSDLLRTPARNLGKRKHSSEKTPSEGSPSGKSPKSIKSEGSLFDMKHLTALKLRRANKILDALKETKVFESVSAIYKMLLSTEAEEGSVEKMDRKTMTQLINWLKTSGKIKILKTVIQQEDKVMELEFVCSPEIGPDDQIIKTFIEHAKMKNFAMKKKYSSKNPKTESLQELPPDLPASIRDSIMRFREYRSKLRNEEMVYDASAYTKYNFLPKIKRHQKVYNYLHYLLYSYDGQLINTGAPSTSSDTTTELDQVESGMQSVFDQIEAMKEPPIYKDEMSWKRFLAPLQCNHGHGKGWCLMSDVLVLLPLVTFCQIVSLPYRIEGLVELLEHPTRRFYPVVSLPPIIRQQVLFARRYTHSFYDSCYQLALMGLLSFGPQIFKEKDKCFIYLQKRACLLDTRSSVMAYCKTWPVKGEGFTQQDYVLETDDDVHMYWCDLEVIALNSNLGYKGVLDKDGEVERGVKLEEALIPIKFEEDPPTHYLPGDRRGAAGFDSSLFLHLIRNWATQLTRRKKPEMPNEFVKKASKKRKRSLSVQETNEGGKLKFLSTSLSQRIPKLASKQKLGLMGPTSVEGGTKTRKVRGNRGGKGVRKKLQDPRTIGRGKKNTKIPKLRTSIRTSSHMRKIRAKKKPEEKIRKRLYDEVDQSALDMMIQERVTWTPHEDTIILLCKTASLLLGRFRRGMVVPWTVVRDILHEAVPESRDKTSTACQRRVAFGMKNPQTMMSVSIYLGEVHQDKAIMERFGSFQYKSVDKNTPTIFKECVKMLINKFTSNDEEKIILPSTLSEMDENYIVKVVGPITNKVPIEDVEKERDVYYYTLQNLIHSYIAAQRDKQGRIHEMYRLFKQYPDDLLARVFSDMHKMGLITKVKNDYSTQSIKKRQFATAVTLKKLTQKYYYSFFSRYPTNMFTQSYAMLDKIVNVFTEGPKDSIELTGNLQGGHVATICGLFAMKKLDFCVRIPEDILIVDHVGLVQNPPGRGKMRPSNTSAPQPSTSSAPSPPPTCTPTVVGGNEMEVVEEVEVSAVTDSDQYMEATHGSVVPEPQTLESIETSMKRRNCRSLIIIEGDVSVGEQLLNRVPTRNASRSLLSLCRNKILSSVDVKSSNVQDHFVINSCDVKVALHLSSSATAAGGLDGRLSEREMEETKGLFLKQQKAKEMYRKHLQYFPFHLDLNEVWEDLGMEYGTDDVIMIKKVYETIDTAGPIGVRESDIKNEYKAVCNISLVIMVLLEQKAILRVGVVSMRLVSLPHARPWLIHSYKNTKGRHSTLSSMDQESDRVSLEEEDRSAPQTRGSVSVCDAGTSTADLNTDESSQTILPDLPKALSTYEKVRLLARPWRKPEGHLNRFQLKFMLESVMMYIMSNPGVRNTLVYQKYSPYLQPAVVQELIEMLEDLNCLTRTCLATKVKATLFSKAKVERVASGSLDDDIVMYEPKMDCTFKLGQFVASLT